jgi:hypothetical protein
MDDFGLSYNPHTGLIHWNPSELKGAAWNGKFAGKEAFTSISDGYRQSNIRGKKYYGHRMAWFLHFGEWPESGMQIDHINGDRADNRIKNLRLATISQNGANRKSGRGASKYLGVSKHHSGKWVAEIQKDGKQKYIGLFEREIDAATAYRIEARKTHGEFAASQ